MPRFSAVLFDMDGTLLDSLTDLSMAVNHALTTLGFKTHSPEVILTFIGHGVRNLILAALPEGEKEIKLDLALSLFHDYYEQHTSDYTAPYPGILDMMETLHEHHIAMAIVSNKDDAFVKALASRFFARYTSVCIGRQQDVPIKPAPNMAQKAMTMLGVSKEETLFVGDSLVDFETAQNTGMQGACICFGFHSHEELKQQGVSTLFDTPEALTQFILNA